MTARLRMIGKALLLWILSIGFRPRGRCAERPVADAVTLRRGALARAGVNAEELPPAGALGLAFSGGGIRSATIALGASQALARHKRLLDFDYLSTVSGGGYIGSFLTTLFLPASSRGLGSQPVVASSDGELASQCAFAHAALTHKARDQWIVHPITGARVRSPVWWLREHGRYLAPNGATDYASSAVYLVRNWLAMLYVFSLPVALIFLLSTCAGRSVQQASAQVAGVAVGRYVNDAIHWRLPPPKSKADDACASAKCAASPMVALQWPHAPASVDIRITQRAPDRDDPPWLWSPILFLTPLFLFVGLAAGLSYWLTAWQPMVRIGTGGIRPRVRFMLGAAGFLSIAIAGLYAVDAVIVPRLPDMPVAGSLFVLLSTTVAAIIALAAGATEWHQPDGAFSRAIRGRLTGAATLFGLIALWLLVLGLIDTLALALLMRVKYGVLTVAVTGIALPVGAWFINKLPQWLGGDGRATRWLVAHSSIVALVAGCVLFGGFAIVIDTLLQATLWTDVPWSEGSDQWSWPIAYGIAAVFVLLALLTGFSEGFINLSSLHNLYAARLTRAYLGGSNIDRLRQSAADITSSEASDDLPIDRYATTTTCAPIHLVNVTLNETRSGNGSQLTNRDRKGVPVVFAPEGILIDAARADTGNAIDWAAASAGNVERLSVGQLCAISGAAASTGMGARTTLGSSIALTFANIRLGYWWRVGRLLNGGKRSLRWTLTRGLRTFFYLLNELTSRYSRDYPGLYLSDGGHFENSGAYELLRRGVGTLLVYDNGADPRFRFEDLENLVRKARLDLGLSINVCSADAVKTIFGAGAAATFLNGPRSADDPFGDDWRARAAARDGAGVALLLCAYDCVGEGTAPAPCHYIIWMKPRLSDRVPQDVRGYGLANAAFPHQSTSDQFFDEAQWESYRALGESMTISLLAASEAKVDILRSLSRRLHKP